MTLEYETPQLYLPKNFILPPLLFAACVVAGATVGGIINCVNGLISPQYFQAVMGWPAEPTETWMLSVYQGVLEGGWFGVGFGLVYTIAAVLITQTRCLFETVMAYLIRAILIAAGLWFAGGIGGVALAICFPQFHRTHFIGVPADRVGQLHHAWVGGSIWGAYLGGLAACIAAPMSLWHAWRKLHPLAAVNAMRSGQ